MELVALNCNECGAKLEVPETAKFVTCNHCDTQLAIKHTNGASFTELAEVASRVEESAKEIEERAEELSGHSELLVLQNDLERLDREWDVERTELMVKGKNGHKHVPSKTQATMLYLIAPVFLFMGIWAYTQSGTWMMLVLSLGVTVVVVFAGMSTTAKAKAFEQARARHEAAREELLGRLGQARTVNTNKAKKRKVESTDDE